jgi:hypothetical protein
MTAARLPVAWDLAGAFEAAAKPDGFSVVWERVVTDELGNPGIEYLIEGPFPEEVEDGARVGLALSQAGRILGLSWQWLDASGKPVGSEIQVY